MSYLIVCKLEAFRTISKEPVYSFRTFTCLSEIFFSQACFREIAELAQEILFLEWSIDSSRNHPLNRKA